MPFSALFLIYASVVLQYTLIILIYFFLWKVLKLAWQDLHGINLQHSKSVACEHTPVRLTVISTGLLTGQEFLLSESLSIGRHNTNDVVINDAFVSFEHACLTIAKQGYILTDLGSTNGTFINDQRIEGDVLLMSGDRITIGPVTFNFER